MPSMLFHGCYVVGLRRTGRTTKSGSSNRTLAYRVIDCHKLIHSMGTSFIMIPFLCRGSLDLGQRQREPGKEVSLGVRWAMVPDKHRLSGTFLDRIKDKFQLEGCTSSRMYSILELHCLQFALSPCMSVVLRCAEMFLYQERKQELPSGPQIFLADVSLLFHQVLPGKHKRA